MPVDLTIFGAKYLVYIEVLVAAAIAGYLLYRRPRTQLVRWGVACCIMLIVAFIAAQIAGAVYNDPRPFVGHLRPLIPHAADNGFPSDHALLAAAAVAGVAFARLRWALLLIPLAVLVEWARVGAGVHHVIDVIGSDLCVALGVLIAVLVAPAVARTLLPMIPSRFLADSEPRDQQLA